MSDALPFVLVIQWNEMELVLPSCCEIIQKSRAISFSPSLNLPRISQYLFCDANPDCPEA